MVGILLKPMIMVPVFVVVSMEEVTGICDSSGNIDGTVCSL
jgi:hypothetical protein